MQKGLRSFRYLFYWYFQFEKQQESDLIDLPLPFFHTQVFQSIGRNTPLFFKMFCELGRGFISHY
jgi:hypothetical protein